MALNCLSEKKKIISSFKCEYLRQFCTSIQQKQIAQENISLNWDLNLEFQMLVALRVITISE